jgi:hypothetical protein
MLRIERIPGLGSGRARAWYGRRPTRDARRRAGPAPRPVGLNSEGTQNAQKRPLTRATQKDAETSLWSVTVVSQRAGMKGERPRDAQSVTRSFPIF